MIPKGDNLPKNDIANWRPIKLTTTDYRIITKVLANRLQNVAGNLINSNQSGFLKNRNISDQIRLIDDVINYHSKTNKHGGMVSLDFRRAFDSITKESIIASLEFFNFGPYFINLIKTIMENTESSVTNGGWISSFFRTERGIRQGCSVSPLLFILVVEILAIKLRTNEDIQGLKINDSDSESILKILQYADDMTLFIKKSKDLLLAIVDIEMFGSITGLHLNKKKSNGMWIVL